MERNIYLFVPNFLSVDSFQIIFERRQSLVSIFGS